MATRRIYYDDSFTRDFTAQVLSCEPVPREIASACEVILDATALYPTSGGQPHDLGKLGEANVLDVREDGDEIVHIVDREVALGSVNGCVDWKRRFDHMQQHTGQHLLSAIFQERFGRPTVSFHLGSDISTIDLRGAEPTEAILEGAERAANQVIFDDRPVNVRYGTAAELADLGVRKEVDRQGILRAIEIEGADLQPCGGTHVRRTAQIGLMLVRRYTKMRQDWRVEFVCGGRTERVARKDFLSLKRTAENLGCAYDDVPESAARLVADRDSRFKEYRSAVQRLAEAEATLALAELPAGSNRMRLITRVFQEDSSAEYLGHFASQIVKGESTIALLARVPCGQLFFAQHASVGKDMNALLKQVLEQLGGKGGGTRDFARGQLSEASQAEAAIAIAKQLLVGE